MYGDGTRRDFEKVTAENLQLKDRISGYQTQISNLRSSLKYAQESSKKKEKQYEERLNEKDAIIKELKNKIAHLAAMAGRDGTNTGISTASTSINKKKVIPNSRRGSGKNKGGQPGHPKQAMEAFEDSEITEIQAHELDLSVETCAACGGSLIDTGEIVAKDEYDVEIHVVKRRHEYHIYECINCGARIRLPISKRLKESNQYGSNVQGLALSLMATGNVAINKVRMLISGMSGGMMLLSEGFICKLYKRAAQGLEGFMAALRRFMICRTLLYWDDTVIMIQTKRACMRFYGDERISFYTAHEHKDMEGLLADNILAFLTPETIVMHDHNRVNYNEQFCFQNIECNQHLQRDLQKIADDQPEHTWALKLKEHISQTIKDRKEAIKKNVPAFSDKYKTEFYKKVEEYLEKGWEENQKSENKYAAPFEENVLERIEKYRENFFRWVEDFCLPTTDNLSERGLRGIKSHMKISGQFDSEKTAKYYAVVKTYIETCRKNDINEMSALSRLCSGNPYTVEEIFG